MQHNVAPTNTVPTKIIMIEEGNQNRDGFIVEIIRPNLVNTASPKMNEQVDATIV